MIKKAIQGLQDTITKHNGDCYADVVAVIKDSDDDRIYLRFEGKKFNRMAISSIDYKFAPKQLRRYYDDEDEMRSVPVEKVIEHLSPLIEEAWVRCEF